LLPLPRWCVVLYGKWHQEIHSPLAWKGGSMGKAESPQTNIDRRFEGEPVQVGDRTVQPVGRVTGKQFGGGNEQGSLSGVLAQLQPLEVVVQEGGQERTIPMADPQRQQLRGIVMTGLAISTGCILLMLTARRLAKRQVKS
jgi:hypothetical protein